MFAIGLLFVRALCDWFNPQGQLEAEILVLRHQLNILQRRTPHRQPCLRWFDGALYHLALSALPVHSERHHHRQARNRCALASQGLYRLLAVEISVAGWSSADRPRSARPDPKDEP